MTRGVDLAEELDTGFGHCFKHFLFFLQCLPFTDIEEGNLSFRSITLVGVWCAVGLLVVVCLWVPFLILSRAPGTDFKSTVASSFTFPYLFFHKGDLRNTG